MIMLPPTEEERKKTTEVLFGTDAKFTSYFQHYNLVTCPNALGDATVEIDTPAVQSHAA